MPRYTAAEVVKFADDNSALLARIDRALEKAKIEVSEETALALLVTAGRAAYFFGIEDDAPDFLRALAEGIATRRKESGSATAAKRARHGIARVREPKKAPKNRT